MNNRNIGLLMACNFLIYFIPHAPVAVLFFERITGSFTLAMGVFAVERAAQILFEIPTGMLSDLLGRRGTLLSGIAARLTGYALFALAESGIMLFAGAVFVGLSIALFSGNNNALVYDTLKDDGNEQAYPTYYGRMNAMLQAGLASSALVGGIAAMQSLRLAFILGVVPQTLVFMLALFVREPRAHSDRVQPNIFVFLRGAMAKFRDNPSLRVYAAGNAMTDCVSLALFVYTPAFFALLWPVWAVGAARTLANMCGAISFWAAGPILAKRKPLNVLIGGHALSRACNLLAFGVPTPLSPLIASATSLFYGVRNVAEHTLLQREFTDAERATLGSMTSFAGSLLFVAVAAVIGALADVFGPAKALFIGELFFLPVIVLYGWLWLHKRISPARAGSSSH